MVVGRLLTGKSVFGFLATVYGTGCRCSCAIVCCGGRRALREVLDAQDDRELRSLSNGVRFEITLEGHVQLWLEMWAKWREHFPIGVRRATARILRRVSRRGRKSASMVQILFRRMP